MATPYLGMTGLKKVGTIKRAPRSVIVTPPHIINVGGAKPRTTISPVSQTIPKVTTRGKVVVASPTAHSQHVAHVAHLAQQAKAKAASTSTKAAGAKSTSSTSSTTLDPHQLHVLHLAHLASLGGGAGSSGGAGGSSTPSGGGGVVGPISSTTGVGGTASSVSSSLFRIAEYAAIILFLIWAWRKGYIQAALKRVGKLGQNSGDKIAKLGKG